MTHLGEDTISCGREVIRSLGVTEFETWGYSAISIRVLIVILKFYRTKFGL